MQFGPKPQINIDRKSNGVNGSADQITYCDLTQTRNDLGRGRAADLIQKMVGENAECVSRGMGDGRLKLLRHLLLQLLTDNALTEPDMHNAHRMLSSGTFDDCLHQTETLNELDRKKHVFGVSVPKWPRDDVALCETILFIVTPSYRRRNVALELESSSCFNWHDQSRVKLLTAALTDAAQDVQYLVATELHRDVKPSLLFRMNKGLHMSDTLDFAMAKEVWTAAYGEKLNELANVDIPARVNSFNFDSVRREQSLEGLYHCVHMSKVQKAAPAAPKTSSKLADMRARLRRLSAQPDEDVLASIGSDTARSNTGKLLQTVSSEVSGQRKH